jgi:hypothetical protein
MVPATRRGKFSLFLKYSSLLLVVEFASVNLKWLRLHSPPRLGISTIWKFNNDLRYLVIRPNSLGNLAHQHTLDLSMKSGRNNQL